jgi:hypothetical protein
MHNGGIGFAADCKFILVAFIAQETSMIASRVLLTERHIA